MRTRLTAFLILLAVALPLVGGIAYAQSDRGSIGGTILDPSAAVVPGAKVTATNLGTGLTQTTQSGSGGDYRVPFVPIGIYSVTVEHPGFNTWQSTNVVVNVNTSVTVDAHLSIGTAATTVTVTDAPPLISEEGLNLGKVMNNKLIMDLPLSIGGDARNTMSFVALTPGVTTAGDLRIGGGLINGTSILLDGAESMSQRRNDSGMNGISVEAIEEFKVQSSSYSAEFGRLSNGIVNFGLKSGTNRFHGTAFDFFRNEYFDANSSSWSPQKKSRRRQDNPGFSVGGPVLKNKLFFFTAYEYAYRVDPQPTNLVTIPTSRIRNGDFTNYRDGNGDLIPLFDPIDANGNLIQDPNKRPVMQCNGVINVICPSRINSQIVTTLQSMLPQPDPSLLAGNTSDRQNNYRAIAQTKGKSNRFSFKIDYNPFPKDRLSFSFARSFNPPYPNLGPVAGVPTRGFGSDSLLRFVRINEDHAFTSNLANQFTFGFDQRRIFEGGPGLSTVTDQLRDSVLFPGMQSRQGVKHGALTQYGTEFVQWGNEVLTDSRQRSESLNDTLSWSHGRHNVKFGFNYYHWLYRRIDCISCNGTISFDGSAVTNNLYNKSGFLPIGPGGALVGGFSKTNVGSNYASFLLGLPSGAGFNWGADQAFSAPYYAWFVQDDWKITPKLTVNLGIRYDLPIPKIERHRNNSNFDPTVPNPAAGGIPGAIVFAGHGPGRSGIDRFGDTRLNAWGPRAGFAYRIYPSTVIRGGGGIFYMPVREDGNADNGNMGFAGRYSSPGNRLAQGVTAQLQSTSSGGFLDPWYQSSSPQAMPAQRPPHIDPGILVGSGVFWYQPKSGRTPYFGTWDLTIEQELGKSSLFRVSYHGNAGIKLLYRKPNFNQLDPKYLYQYGDLLLNKQINDPAVRALGIPIPSWVPSNYRLNQVLRPFPQYSGVNINAGGAADGHSTWNALEASIEHRYADGLQLLAAYTFSKLVGDTDGEDANRGDGAAQNHYNLKAERSIDRDDQTHSISLSYVYELPFGRGRKYLANISRPANYVLGGWKISGIERFNSSTPIQIGGGLTWMGGASSNSRASFAPGYGPNSQLKNPQYNRFVRTSSYINKDAFRKAPFYAIPNGAPDGKDLRYGTYGDTPRFISQLRGHWGIEEDVSVLKNFNVTESKLFEFRASAFNFPNRRYQGNPSNSVDNSDFGQVGNPQGNSPRSVQFGLKFLF